MAARRNDRQDGALSEAMAHETLLDGDVTTSDSDSAETEADTEAEAEAEAGATGPDKPDKRSRPRRPPEKRGTRGPDGPFEWVEFAARVFGAVGVGVAAIVATMEFSEANTDLKSERSLEYVRNWQREGLSEDFAAVNDFVAPRFASVRSIIEQLEPGAPRNRALRNFANTWLDRNRTSLQPVDIEPRIERLILYFSQMEICINAELCEAKVLALYFRSEVESFWAYFNGYAETRRRDGYGEYGLGVDRLLIEFAKEAAE